MAAVEVEDFDIWLNSKLKALNTDENVFGSYIKSILEGEESLEDKTEALEEILTEIIETDIIIHSREIIDRWKKLAQNGAQVGQQNGAAAVTEDMEIRLSKLLESKTKPAAVQRTYTEEEKKIREAILSQYSQMSDHEESGDEAVAVASSSAARVPESKENSLVKNTNASSVAQAEKEKREKAKLDSQKKKEKDKEDREKQKQMQQDKKEKRKTQKGERRR